jgi:hypothetical protein
VYGGGGPYSSYCAEAGSALNTPPIMSIATAIDVITA